MLPLSVTHFPIGVPSIGGFLFLARVSVNFSSSQVKVYLTDFSGKYLFKVSNLSIKV